MTDFKFSPKANGKKEKAKALLYAAIALVAFIFGMLPVAGKGIIQLIFVVFVALDIMHCIKYFLTAYTYTLTEEYGDAMIVVTQTQGKRISTLANFRIADIKNIELMSQKQANEAIEKKYGASCVKYNYTVSTDEEKSIILTVRNDYTRYIVMLTYNDEFYGVLSVMHSELEIIEEE